METNRLKLRDLLRSDPMPMDHGQLVAEGQIHDGMSSFYGRDRLGIIWWSVNLDGGREYLFRAVSATGDSLLNSLDPQILVGLAPGPPEKAYLRSGVGLIAAVGLYAIGVIVIVTRAFERPRKKRPAEQEDREGR